MSTASNPFLIIGHRGAAGEKLENSLDGFRHALALDVDAVELDVREHSNHLWVMHDHDLGRLTGTAGLFEAHPDPAQITLRNAEAVPGLSQVLDLYWGKMPLNIEIKSVNNPRLLLDLLAAYPELPAASGFPWILISSFNHRSLLQLRQLHCLWPLAPISSGVPLQFGVELQRLAPYSWHFDDEYVDFEQVRQLREHGVASLVYTVNDPERARVLRENGVAGIFTDLPSEMLRFV